MNIREFEDELGGLQGAIPGIVRDGEVGMLLDFGFPRMHRLAEDVASKLKDLKMYDTVLAGLSDAEKAVREGRYEAAQDVILEISRELMNASGTTARLKARYGKRTALSEGNQ